MPAPHVVECPVCFATLKLKASPKPGARLKCPKCAGVFSPFDDDPAPVEEEAEEDEAPIARSKSRSKGKKTKKKSANLAVPITIAAILLVLIGVGVGLFLARDSLFGGSVPVVDLAYCQIPQRSMTLEFRVQEFLQSPAVTEEIRKGPQFGESSPAMKELFGAEIGDVDVMQAQFTSPPGGFNPMAGPAMPTDALAILKCRKPLTPPATGAFEHQGIKCYRITEASNTGMGLKTDTMFFPNPTTVVLGREASVRQMLDNWKANGPKPAAGIANSGTTMFFVAEQSLVSSAVSQASTGNPMMMMGPGAAMAEDLKATGSVLSQQATAFSVAAQLTSGQITWTASVHSRDSGGAQQIQNALNGLRIKILELVTMLTQGGLPLPEANKKQFELAKQTLSTPLQATGDRVSLAIPVPADQQAASIGLLANMMPPMKFIKPGSSATSTATTSPGTTPPAMPTPGMPTPGMPSPTMPTPGVNPAATTPTVP